MAATFRYTPAVEADSRRCRSRGRSCDNGGTEHAYCYTPLDSPTRRRHVVELSDEGPLSDPYLASVDPFVKHTRVSPKSYSTTPHTYGRRGRSVARRCQRSFDDDSSDDAGAQF